ncbi:hypothetical protein [Ktedonobacter robiniae]|uniref:hypothetical protein n=1 Tax=Ktedonobacter robiniae TaxID=2778365 RepID=UPI001915AE50|nr:hypothetical protein [Ktedonobacter robiniae]
MQDAPDHLPSIDSLLENEPPDWAMTYRGEPLDRPVRKYEYLPFVALLLLPFVYLFTHWSLLKPIIVLIGLVHFTFLLHRQLFPTRLSSIRSIMMVSIVTIVFRFL